MGISVLGGYDEGERRKGREGMLLFHGLKDQHLEGGAQARS